MRYDLPLHEDFDRVAGALLDAVPPALWEGAELSARERLLAALHASLVSSWSLSPVSLSVGDLEDGSLGYFDPGASEVVVEEGLLDEADIAEALGTLVHELRHALQQEAIADPGVHPLGVEGAGEALRWKQADESYEADRLDLTSYAYNAQEADAFGVERAVLASYWKQAYFRFRGI